MEIETQYAVRLFFPASAFTQVYLEAVANALDAGADEIIITIMTEGDISPDRLEVTVRDNGAGFTDERFESFRRLQEPPDPYHKGLGRLVFLQYFRTVDVDSVFDGRRRTFTFSDKFAGGSLLGHATAADTRGTSLRFRGFRKERLRSYDDLKPRVVKQIIIDHFLLSLHEKKKRGEDFRILIELETNSPNSQYELNPEKVTVTPADVPEFRSREVQRPELGFFETISMWYVIRDRGIAAEVLTGVSVDGRTLPIRLISSNVLPPGYGATFLFESDIFHGHSDVARQRLVLPDNLPEDTLFRVLREEVAAVLRAELPQIEERNVQTRQHFEERYPHLAGLFDDDTVGIIDRNEALDQAQRRFFAKQKDVLESDSVSDERFLKSLELSARTLAEYVLYRDVIIKKLASIGPEDKEEKVHNLIVPRYRRFEGDSVLDGVYSNNAWLLDDKFMAFRTILSESRMDEVIRAITLNQEGVTDSGRPDIAIIFSADPAEEEAVDVVVVEVKRRSADDKESLNAAAQLVKRAEKLVAHCPRIQRVWYFGVVEIDNDLERLLWSMQWTPLFSRGKVFYQELRVERTAGLPVPMPTYMLSYDAVIKDAEARNHTFMAILKRDIRSRSSE